MDFFWCFFCSFFLTIFLKYTNNERLFTAIYVQCTPVNKYDVRMVRANDACGSVKCRRCFHLLSGAAEDGSTYVCLSESCEMNEMKLA